MPFGGKKQACLLTCKEIEGKMKDRIKKIMEEQHMTQQVFSEFISVAPATLSSIFTGRTRPTLNIVEAIKNKLPAISTDWLMFGRGEMYVSRDGESQENLSDHHENPSDKMLHFEDSSTPSRPAYSSQQDQGTLFTAPQRQQKNIAKSFPVSHRQITEIRVFYDDQTWETFIPKK